ncbi:MAG: uracil-DNA glycosylase [Pseudomonadota bacterium]
MLFEPEPDCRLCPRLAGMRDANRLAQPDWFNRPVPSFGDPKGRLVIVGLAPGLQGANRTGRPFTGDYAGDLLYATLAAHGFTEGQYGAHALDGLRLRDCLISNAVRCVPPQNKPDPAEIAACRPFLKATIEEMANARIILALGKIAHDSIVAIFGLRLSNFKFAHGACHSLPGGRLLVDSYHCSRYNTNTRRLTPDMFNAIFVRIRELIGQT